MDMRQLHTSYHADENLHWYLASVVINQNDIRTT